MYHTIRCHTKQCFWRRINTRPFTFSFRAKKFVRQTIYILFSPEVDNLCSCSVKIGHCAFCSCDMNGWPVTSLRFGQVVLLSPAQLYLYEPRIELTFILGEKGLVRDDSCSKDGGSTIVSLFNVFCKRFCLRCPHYKFLLCQVIRVIRNIVSWIRSLRWCECPTTITRWITGRCGEEQKLGEIMIAPIIYFVFVVLALNTP